eukprot:3598195-Pleurochrysis_carterae.AAC.1
MECAVAVRTNACWRSRASINKQDADAIATCSYFTPGLLLFRRRHAYGAAQLCCAGSHSPFATALRACEPCHTSHRASTDLFCVCSHAFETLGATCSNSVISSEMWRLILCLPSSATAILRPCACGRARGPRPSRSRLCARASQRSGPHALAHRAGLICTWLGEVLVTPVVRRKILSFLTKSASTQTSTTSHGAHAHTRTQTTGDALP